MAKFISFAPNFFTFIHLGLATKNMFFDCCYSKIATKSSYRVDFYLKKGVAGLALLAYLCNIKKS